MRPACSPHLAACGSSNRPAVATASSLLPCGVQVEPKWAKGIQAQGSKGWSIGFQIKGKRQSMTVYCSQAEAAVVYDLAAIWANKQKGNNPENSTYYNFSIL